MGEEKIHSLMAILTEASKYKAEHGNAKFLRPVPLPLYDKNIANNATTVVWVRAGAAHKSCLDDYARYEATKRGVAKFLRDVVDEIWYNDLKDADTFYTKVTAIDIMALLDANSGGLHAIDMISLRTNMTQYVAVHISTYSFCVVKPIKGFIAHKNCLMAPSHRGEGEEYKREHLTRWRQFPALNQTCFDLLVSTPSDYISDPYQHHL